MAIQALNLIYRSTRRLRVVFSNNLAAGAFNASWFNIAVSEPPLAVGLAVTAGLAVLNSPNVVELVLTAELESGRRYDLTVFGGVPATDASTTVSSVALPLTVPSSAPLTSASDATRSVTDALYGVDLAWDGRDFVEGPDGDLQVVRGVENVRSALERRALSGGLAWRTDYGAKARAHVDAPETAGAEFRAELVAQARADDRVKSAKARKTSIQGRRDESLFELEAELVGGAVVVSNVSNAG